MPYTPPTPRSPATSNKASPTITRNHSYDETTQSQSRPDLPRSRSAQYLQKHRRTPSLADVQHHGAQHHGLHGHQTTITYSDGNAAITSGPVCISSEAAKPLAAGQLTMSPVDVGGSEDDEDRGRIKQIAHLAHTLKNTNNMLITKRQHSPSKSEETEEQQVSLVIDTASPGLTPEARKISHSRSSSEMLSIPVNQSSVFEQSSREESDEDDLELRRIPLLRKKSGELVKPALRGTSAHRRPISAPGTPTFAKAVHFNENIEQVRHFLQIDKPSAVSVDSSPVETYESETEYPFMVELGRKSRTPEWEISTNLRPESHEHHYRPIRMEQLTLSQDGKSLNGVVAVANISFDKWVFARFTFDYWKTTSEIACEWSNIRYNNSSDGYDRFTFSIRLSDQANLQNKTLFLCTKYNVAGQEHWDNNSGANYQVDFSRKVVAKPPVKAKTASAQVTPTGIPRSRHSPKGGLPRPRSFPFGSSDDEFSTSFESPFRLKGKIAGLRDPNSHTFNDQTQQNLVHRLSVRYDFNASLHAALSNAQDALGDASGLTMKSIIRPVTAPASSASALPPKRPAQASRQDSNSARPTLGSVEYQALIQKFCYFGSPMGNNTADTSPQPELEDVRLVAATQPLSEETGNMSSDDSTNSTSSSTSNSPPSPKVHLHQPEPKPASKSDLITEAKASARTPSPSLLARSPRLHPFRTPSPALSSVSAYQEFQHHGLSIQSAQC